MKCFREHEWKATTVLSKYNGLWTLHFFSKIRWLLTLPMKVTFFLICRVHLNFSTQYFLTCRTFWQVSLLCQHFLTLQNNYYIYTTVQNYYFFYTPKWGKKNTRVLLFFCLFVVIKSAGAPIKAGETKFIPGGNKYVSATGFCEEQTARLVIQTTKILLARGNGEVMHICCLNQVPISVSIFNLLLHWKDKK